MNNSRLENAAAWWKAITESLEVKQRPMSRRNTFIFIAYVELAKGILLYVCFIKIRTQTTKQ